MAPAKPMLDGVELPQAQRIASEDEEVLAQHGVPALEGDFLQDLGRRAVRVSLTGVMTGAEAGEDLKGLREKFRAAQPVPFVSDIATATRVDKVLIEEMGVRELAGKPERFEYALALREYTPPPAVEVVDPPDIPVPPLPQIARLVVTVLVENEPDFDFGRVTVRASGTDAEGVAVSRTLFNRTGNVWTEEDFPPGRYTVEAAVAEPDAMTGSAAVEVRPGETAEAAITLRRGARIAKAFIIHFWFDKAFVEPCLREVLQRVVAHSDAHPNEKVLIVGHTDLTGPDNYNQALSERRARSVHAFLTFGRNRERAVAEWNELRRTRPPGLFTSVKDTWDTREVQYMLQDLRFYLGNIDEDHGPLTSAAVRAFQTDNGLTPTGAMDDATWEKLVAAYLEQDSFALPEERFFRNARGDCNGGVLQWIGCGETDPVLNTELAWRPNRRTEILFLTTDTLPPGDIPEPDTFNLPEEGVAGTGWCLGPRNPNLPRCPFTTRTAPPAEGKVLIRPAEPGKVLVSGTITFEDGTPVANAKYSLTAPDGEYLNTAAAGADPLLEEKQGPDPAGTPPRRKQKGRPVPNRADAQGRFSFQRETPEGVYILELQELTTPQVARSTEEAPGSGVGNVVCFRLDAAPPPAAEETASFAAQAPSAPTPATGKGGIVQSAPAPVVDATPEITPEEPVVVVKRSYTRPARVRITLRTSAPSRGKGTLTRSGNTSAIKLFTAATGGTEITFDGTDNVFSGDRLKGNGVQVFAESDSPSSLVGDFKLTLTLTSGAAKTVSATAVRVTLDICAPRTAPGVEPVPLPGNDKVDVGRFVQRGEPNNSHDRTMILVHRPTPAGFSGNLVLVRNNDRVRAFDSSDEQPLPGQTPLPARHPISPGSIVLPSRFKRLFVEGTAVSNAPRDTGFRLGIEGVEDDGDRVAITVFALEMIRQANTAIPMQGNDACLMVSKAVTNVNLPDTATFAGPPGANPDPDTFRLQVRGLPAGETLTLSLDVLRGTTFTYTHEFPMLEGNAGGRPAYRTNEHVRLVSNAVDDAHLDHQTPLVRLEDVVRATLLRNGQRLARIDLPVGRPPSEDGLKAIRTVDINFVTLRGVSSNPQATVDEMSRNWAQLAIRFNRVSTEIVDPVTNVLTVDGTANRDGQLSVDVTPQGGTVTTVTVPVRRGQTDRVIAQNVAAAITAQTGLPASHHRHQDLFIVLVNRRNQVNFTNATSTVPTVVFTPPPLNFTDEINLLEGSVLGLNFSDNDPSTIDIIAVGRVPILGTNLGATGGDFLAVNLPGWRNVAIIREEAVRTNNASIPLVAGHEMGHALLDGSDEIHLNTIPTNLISIFANVADTIGVGKRLNDAQNLRVRQRSGPNTVPPLLQKK
jgi:outer membrane protein OmpA-like peptidoglycan-associated protein